ncbi:MAG: hypothetical protein ACYCWW_04015 [Deltaproteobacteria bacterium]
MLSAPLRNAALYLSAMNQSRAKVVFDPIYELVARALLRDDPPMSPKLLEKRYPEILFLDYRARNRKLAYYVEDWDFSLARPELLTPRQRQMMHTVALGETSGAAVGDGFLRAFRTIPDLAAFFGVWFVEELNHFLGYHRYLERMNEAWPQERALAVAEVEFRPYSDDPMELAACNMYQELLGYLIYRSFGQQARDPFLSKMLTRFAKDELRHYIYYQDVVGRHLQAHPGFRRTILKVFLKATSPFNQVSGGPKQFVEHLRRGIFYFRKAEFDYFGDQLELLLGKRLDGFFGRYFEGQLPPCQSCQKELYLCGCEEYEPEVPRLHEARRPFPVQAQA